MGGLVAFFIYGLCTTFDPENDYAEIKQNIGGTLICNAVFSADHHTWQYEVSYKFKTQNDSLVEIGTGTYHARIWKKDEQLITFKNWLFLKTGGWIRTDKAIVGDLKTKQWNEYEFVPKHIEKDTLWQASKTTSLLDYCCSETYIDTIINGQIIVSYKFRTSETQTDEYGERKIYYTINELTGQPEMTKVE